MTTDTRHMPPLPPIIPFPQSRIATRPPVPTPIPSRLPLTTRQPVPPLPDPTTDRATADAYRAENRALARRVRAAEDRFNRLLLALIAVGLVAAATLLVVRLSTGG